MATIYLGDKHAVKMPEHGAAAEIGLTFRMQYLEIIIATVSSLQGSVQSDGKGETERQLQVTTNQQQ